MKKTGRPLGSVKTDLKHQILVRLTDREMEMLSGYAERHEMSRQEVLRRLIRTHCMYFL